MSNLRQNVMHSNDKALLLTLITLIKSTGSKLHRSKPVAAQNTAQKIYCQSFWCHHPSDVLFFKMSMCLKSVTYVLSLYSKFKYLLLHCFCRPNIA
uniref:Uncharacterized protein n=1 Tax=Anguilla anguilla TaxID=7936 RepID=A0A0E9XS61_ANGAN